jgi:hypothetical protein
VSAVKYKLGFYIPEDVILHLNAFIPYFTDYSLLAEHTFMRV